MEIKYIVKSETYPNQYLSTNVDLGRHIAPIAFKICNQNFYEVAKFDSEEEALFACEEAAKYYSRMADKYIPVILKIVV